MINYEGKLEDCEFMQSNIIMYFKNELGFENIKYSIPVMEKVILEFDDEVTLDHIVNILNECIRDFKDDFEKLKILYKVNSSFEIMVGNKDNVIVKFNYYNLK